VSPENAESQTGFSPGGVRAPPIWERALPANDESQEVSSLSDGTKGRGLVSSPEGEGLGIMVGLVVGRIPGVVVVLTIGYRSVADEDGPDATFITWEVPAGLPVGML
jgi:hypothetical protein